MRKLLLNLVPGEPFALVQELASFDNPIWLDLLLVSVLDLHVHDTIHGGLFHAVWFNSVGVSFFLILEVSSRGGK